MARSVTIDGISWIQVHPTFLYESVWNICLAVCLLFVTYRIKNRLPGDVALLYMTGYALGRACIEGLRTDRLLIPGTELAVSQLLSIVLATGGIFILLYRHRKGDRL